MKVDTIDLSPPTYRADGETRPEVVVAIGSFDGVHRGHRYLLDQVVSRARDLGASSLVVTFAPLPAEVLHHQMGVELTGIDERLDLLAGLRVERTAVVRFTSEFARLSPDAFLDQLESRYRIREMWAGADFGFGHRRQGNVEFLRGAGSIRGFAVTVVERQTAASPELVRPDRRHAASAPFSAPTLVGMSDPGTGPGEPLASSRIRELIRAGRVEEAAWLLGHLPTVGGPVVAGAGRGRPLGFPTANVAVPASRVMPAPGIYAGFATITSGEPMVDGQPHVDEPTGGRHRWEAAISIGHNPQFGVNPLSVEAFILDFDQDILGRTLRLELAGRLRDEATFPTVGDLVHQIARDVEAARRLLAGTETGTPVPETPTW